MTVTSAQVVTLLENVLFESATVATANATSLTPIANFNSTTSTVAGLSAYLATLPEATIAEQVVRYYQGALGRVPSPSEIAFYVKYAETGLTAAQIAQGSSAVSTATWSNISGFFASSPEFQKDYGLTGGLTAANEAIVITGFYNNILNRAPSQSEITFYENALNTGGATPATLVQFFTNSPEYTTKANPTIVSNLSAAGVAAVNTVAAGGTPLTSTTPIGNLPSATPTVVALTTGVDNVTGVSNVTINGSDTTVTALDSIALTGNGNVFNVNDVAGSAANFTVLNGVSGVQTFNLTSSSDLKNAAIDVSGWTGLAAANIKLIGTATAADAITAASTTAVSVTATDAFGTAFTFTGGSSVSLTDSVATGKTALTTTVNGVKGTTSVSIVETGSGTHGAANVYDVHYPGDALTATKPASTLTTVTLDGIKGASKVDSDALATLTLNNSTSVVTVKDATAKSTLALNVSNDSGAAQVTDANNVYTTVNVTTGAKASTVELTGTSIAAVNVAGSSVLTLNSASSVAAGTAVAVSGAAGLTVTTTGLTAGTITSITSTSSGVVNATIDGTATTFTGGAGQDIVTIAAAATKTITGGSATNNEIVWNGTGVVNLGSTVSGFTTLGIGSAYADSASTAINMSSTALKGFNSLDVAGTSGTWGTAGGTINFTNVAAGTALAIDASVHNATATAIKYVLSGSSAATSSVALSLGTTGASSFTVDALTLADASANGVGTVSVTTHSSATSVADTITTLTDANLTTLNVAGTADFTITNAVSTAATSVTINATETGSSNGVTLGGITDNSLTTLSFTGSAAVTLTTLSDSGSTGTLSITDGDTGAVAITSVSNGTAHTLSFATISVTNSGTGKLSIETGSGILDNSLTALNLNGNVAITVAGDTATTGVTVAGATDNSTVSLTITGSASGKTDTITLGNGNDTVAITAGAGTENITLGNGGTSSSVQTVTLTGTTGAANVTVGTGMNTVVLGASGVDTVTFGSHSPTATVFDTVNVSNVVTNSFSPVTTASQTSVVASALDVITGLHSGDKLVFNAQVTGFSVSAANGLAGSAGNVDFAHGTYSASNGTFTYSASGTDTLATFVDSATPTYGSIVLVGVSVSTSASISGHTVTLG